MPCARERRPKSRKLSLKASCPGTVTAAAAVAAAAAAAAALTAAVISPSVAAVLVAAAAAMSRLLAESDLEQMMATASFMQAHG